MARIVFSEHRSTGNGGVDSATTGKPSTKTGFVPGAASAQSQIFGSTTRVVRVSADVACHVGYGGTADVNDDLVGPGSALFAVQPGSRLSFRTAG